MLSELPILMDTYIQNGACQVKGMSSTRQTIQQSDNSLLTEKFANNGCVGVPLIKKKTNNTCDASFQTYSLVHNFNTIPFNSKVTVPNCLHTDKVIVTPETCNQAVGSCVNNTAYFCGTQREELYNAFVSGSSGLLISGIVRTSPCTERPTNKVYYRLNGGCFTRTRAYILGNMKVVESYTTNNCTGTFTSEITYTTPGDCVNGVKQTVISELPTFPDTTSIIVSTASGVSGNSNTCGAVQRVIEIGDTLCLASGRGVCTTQIPEDPIGYFFCGSDTDLWIDSFKSGILYKFSIVTMDLFDSRAV